MSNEPDPLEGANGPTWSLDIPFVVVESVGGPFNDDAYVAGWEAAMVNYALGSRHIVVTTMMVHEANLKQLDIIAMAKGYNMDELARYEEAPGWVQVGFNRDDSPIPTPEHP